MLVNEANLLVAPCGLFCGGCFAHTATDAQTRESLMAMGMREGSLPCPGCRSIAGRCPVMTDTCATFTCADRRGLEFCFECPDFPCHRLMPTADKAGILPHNTKVFNLCFIKQKGLDTWKKEAQEIQNKYFFGKMALGKGPLFTE